MEPIDVVLDTWGKTTEGGNCQINKNKTREHINERGYKTDYVVHPQVPPEYAVGFTVRLLPQEQKYRAAEYEHS